jgi:peptidyl-prolyl cis-trans isomerase SurA
MDMRWKSWILSVSLFLSLECVISLSLAEADVVDRIVAYVNDDVITLSELNERTHEFIAMREQNPFLPEQDQSSQAIRREVLDGLINDRLTAQEIARLEIKVSEAEVDEVIDNIKKENQLSTEAVEAQLRKEGMTMEDLRRNIRKSLEQNQLIQREVRRKTVVTDELVEAYYQSHLEDFQEKERWRLHDIFLPIRADATPEEGARLYAYAQQILDRLRQGADFAAMAQRYSRGPGAEAGGDLGFFSKGELEPVLEKAIETLEPGEISPVIPTDRGLHILKVTDVDQTNAKSLDEVREKIRRLLYQREIDFKYREWLSGLRERSYVKIVD